VSTGHLREPVLSVCSRVFRRRYHIPVPDSVPRGADIDPICLLGRHVDIQIREYLLEAQREIELQESITENFL
jgi:hypothetical protein